MTVDGRRSCKCRIVFPSDVIFRDGTVVEIFIVHFAAPAIAMKDVQIFVEVLLSIQFERRPSNSPSGGQRWENLFNIFEVPESNGRSEGAGRDVRDSIER